MNLLIESSGRPDDKRPFEAKPGGHAEPSKDHVHIDAVADAVIPLSDRLVPVSFMSGPNLSKV
jgi:hypothetical protein